MTTIAWVKIAIAVLGLTIWLVGLRQEDATIRWIGIAVLTIAALMRFYRPRPRDGTWKNPPA